jgi:Fic-DOC domain mobile mystery protein B
MGLDMQYEVGQTPLNEEKLEELLLPSVTTRGELDEHEHLNIEEAVEWLMRTKPGKDKILTEAFILQLHKKMLGKVWAWAGKFRRSEKNIGVPWINIGVELRQLLDDTRFWINNHTYEPDEIAIRFKHRLVNIHCFPNGNGRHARLMADLLIATVFEQPAFSWHNSNMVKANEIRKQYISAIRAADKGDIQPLIAFARSK